MRLFAKSKSYVIRILLLGSLFISSPHLTDRLWAQPAMMHGLARTQQAPGATVFDSFTPSTCTEFIISGVPWYVFDLVCGITSDMMILGYWDDHGYNDLIPGGSSSTGYLRAAAEEIFWLGEANRGIVERYTSAGEYGLHSIFLSEFVYRPDWSAYKYAMDTYRQPVKLAWIGPPFGGHSMVGIGYKDDGEKHFLIGHDTWTYDNVYVDFDLYKENCLSMTRYYPSAQPGVADTSGKPIVVIPSDSLTLTPVQWSAEPFLNHHQYSYQCFELADMDGDHASDLLICTFDYSLQMYLNQGDRFVKNDAFQPQLTIVNQLRVIKAADYDQDGDTDFAVTGMWAPVYIFINENGTIANKPLIVDDQGRGFTDLDWADYNRDGHLDLAAATLNGKIRLYKQQDGAFAQDGEIGDGVQYLETKFCDLQGDGYPEVLACDRYGSVSVFRNDAGLISGVCSFQPENAHGALAFDAADIDGDTYAEVVTVHDGQIVIFDNFLGKLSAQPIYLDAASRYYAKDIVLSDLNGDRFPELIIGCYNSLNAVFLNRGGRLSAHPVWTLDKVDPTVRVHVFDRKGDGSKELVFLHPRGSAVEIYRTGFATAVSDNVKPQPSKITLRQNYPNPFNAHTVIGFDLPRMDHVQIKVFDVSGKEQTVLLDQSVSAGRHQVQWNATGYSSGVYFLVLQSGVNRFFRKMMLVR